MKAYTGMDQAALWKSPLFAVNDLGPIFVIPVVATSLKF
jgi:hypothetical protein